MKKTAVITGGSSGIGYELAKEFIDHGVHVLLVSRGEEELAVRRSELEKHNISVSTLALDLTTQGAAKKLFDYSMSLGGDIDSFVNNAGFGFRGEFTELSLDRQLNMIDLNVRVLTELAYLFGNYFKEKKRGRILNVASTAAFQPGPFMNVYYATKAYVQSFSQALTVELEPYGVVVTCLSPGPTDTNFAKRASAEDSKLFNSSHLMTAHEVAQAGFVGMMHKKRLVVPGFANKLFSILSRILPTIVALKLVKKVNSSNIK